ncbi:MAG: cytochrome c maturation protein CcmE [Lysobacterales bacterium CG02_land_8_20_14_3_00_62_12]|nr:MAG: cytochrome c maturation protein CcmE [Xanthomonadales bacterium CG02_land_8_20_14_3_00_62_12]
MNPIRRRRLLFILLGLLALGIAAALVLLALRQNLQHFVSPSDVKTGQYKIGSRFRLGGVVEEGSFKRRDNSLDVSFVVTDRFETVSVDYLGIMPDLFREGQSVIATGALVDPTHFRAEEILAKHDEKYMPKEVADAIARAKAKNAERQP